MALPKNHSLKDSISFFSKKGNKKVLCINEDVEVDGILVEVSEECSNINQAKKFWNDNPCFDDFKHKKIDFDKFLADRKDKKLPKLDY